MNFPLRLPRSAWKTPVQFACKAWSVLCADGMALSGRPDIEVLSLERDFPAIERLLDLEQWPFVRADLEISHAQPRAVAYVARKEGQFAGFYAAHHFGDVGYLDMAIVAPEFRRQGVIRPLHVRVVRALQQQNIRSFVVHTTTDSAPLIWMLGFRAGQTFTLLARDPVATPLAPLPPSVRVLTLQDAPTLMALDAEVFGVRREAWIAGLLRQPSTRFFGLWQDGMLTASLCLRARRHGAVGLDGANARQSDAMALLVRSVLQAYADRRVECFVRDGAALAGLLRDQGFAVPEFFKAIGPLTEWRKGQTGQVGRTPLFQCLSWF